MKIVVVRTVDTVQAHSALVHLDITDRDVNEVSLRCLYNM